MGEGDGIDLNHIEKEKPENIEEDWKPDHYEPDGGVHGYTRGGKSVDINSSWNRLPKKEEMQPEAKKKLSFTGKRLEEKQPEAKKKLSIKELVLQRKKDLEAKIKFFASAAFLDL